MEGTSQIATSSDNIDLFSAGGDFSLSVATSFSAGNFFMADRNFFKCLAYTGNLSKLP
jgi:hypothetical protein